MKLGFSLVPRMFSIDVHGFGVKLPLQMSLCMCIYICMYMRQNSCGFTFSDLQSHSSLPPAWLLEKVESWNSGCFWFCLICESNGQIVCLCYSRPYSLKPYIFLKNSLYCCLGRRGGISPLTACCLWLKHDISGP